MTYVEFAGKLHDLAAKTHGLQVSDAPEVKTLQDVISGRRRPNCKVLFLIQLATDGDVDAEQFVLDQA